MWLVFLRTRLALPIARAMILFILPTLFIVLLGPAATATTALAPDAFLVPLADQVSTQTGGPVAINLRELVLIDQPIGAAGWMRRLSSERPSYSNHCRTGHQGKYDPKRHCSKRLNSKQLSKDVESLTSLCFP